MYLLGMTVSTLQQKQQSYHAHETEGAGDMWDHAAVAADSKLVVRLVVGKRTQEQTQALVQDARRRLREGICQRFLLMPLQAVAFSSVSRGAPSSMCHIMQILE